MEESKGLPERRRNAHSHLKAAKTANFPGSFVVNHLDEAPRRYSTPQDAGKLADWAHYFRDGWDDVGIWKSAVSRWSSEGAQILIALSSSQKRLRRASCAIYLALLTLPSPISKPIL